MSPLICRAGAKRARHNSNDDLERDLSKEEKRAKAVEAKERKKLEAVQEKERKKLQKYAV